jgi:hypothetical protein
MHTADDYRRELAALGWSATEEPPPDPAGGYWTVTATRGDESVTGSSLNNQAGAWRMALELASRKGRG